VVLREPQRKDQFVPIVRHGVEFLKDMMWGGQAADRGQRLDLEGRVSRWARVLERERASASPCEVG
jgi:hypothetical protein